jgi:hypothetical protein
LRYLRREASKTGQHWSWVDVNEVIDFAHDDNTVSKPLMAESKSPDELRPEIEHVECLHCDAKYHLKNQTHHDRHPQALVLVMLGPTLHKPFFRWYVERNGQAEQSYEGADKNMGHNRIAPIGVNPQDNAEVDDRTP